MKSNIPAFDTVEMKFWAVLPDCVRVDVMAKDGQSETKVEITRGSERFKRNADGSVEVENGQSRVGQDGDLLPTDYRRHFDRSLIRQFFASLLLEQIGECKVAGRECVRIRAVPVPGDQIWPHWLREEADEFEFAADLIFPSLLLITCLLKGKTIERIEVVDVTFNQQIDETVFICEPSSGQSIRKAVPVTQRISLSAAVAKVPFTVLLPKIGADEESPDLYYEPSRRDGSGESLTVFYHQTDLNTLWFTLREHPDPEMNDTLEWEAVEVEGRRFELSDPESEGGLIVLKFCQDGTWITLYSDRTRVDLLNIALSFEAVST